MASPEVVHLLVRYRDPAPGIDTIREHEKLLAEHGAVWFGKFGKAVGAGSIDLMRDQVRARVPTFLYLTTRRDKGQLEVHRGHVDQLTGDTLPPAEEGSLIPTYYSRIGLQPDVRLWARLTRLEEIPEERLDGLVVASSRRPVRDSLRSTAPFLLVAEGAPTTHG
jgi:hypothetical protein